MHPLAHGTVDGPKQDRHSWAKQMADAAVQAEQQSIRISQQVEYSLFQLLAQVELATTSFEKWSSRVTHDQVLLAFRRYSSGGQ